MAFSLPVWLAIQEDLLARAEEKRGAPSCYDAFDDEALMQLFHLTRPCLVFIRDAVHIRMKQFVRKKHAMSVDMMLMVSLNFYAHGRSSAAILQQVGLTRSRCTAVISTVSGVIAGMSDQFISFPLIHTAKTKMASKMEKICGIPNVLGVLAPAHFNIIESPYEKDRSFVNSLGYTSVVSQVICDYDGNILSVEKCCVGSTCEQEMWDSSFKGRELEEELHGPFGVIGKMCVKPKQSQWMGEPCLIIRINKNGCISVITCILQSTDTYCLPHYYPQVNKHLCISF